MYAAGSIGSGVLGAWGSSNAAEEQAKAIRDAMAQQKAIYDQQWQAGTNYRKTGEIGLNDIQGLNDYWKHTFGNEDLNSNLSPNYAFQLGQGEGAVRNLANSSGGLIGGNAIQGLNEFNQNFAGNAYQNAFNNYQNQRQNIFGNLNSIAGIGQHSLDTTAGLAGNYMNNLGTTGVGLGNANASGTMGVANALGGTLGNLGNFGSIYNMMRPPTSASPVAPVAPVAPGGSMTTTTPSNGGLRLG